MDLQLVPRAEPTASERAALDAVLGAARVGLGRRRARDRRRGQHRRRRPRGARAAAPAAAGALGAPGADRLDQPGRPERDLPRG